MTVVSGKGLSVWKDISFLLGWIFSGFLLPIFDRFDRVGRCFLISPIALKTFLLNFLVPDLTNKSLTLT